MRIGAATISSPAQQTTLNTGSTHQIIFNPKAYWFHTGIQVTQGEHYHIQANQGTPPLKDCLYPSDADGYEVLKALKAYLSPKLRIPAQRMFSLCGSIGEDDAHVFHIGKETTLAIPKTGELTLFVNELQFPAIPVNRRQKLWKDFIYGNNTGSLNVSVSKLNTEG